ncbi:MAG: flagellar assembly protein FliW [Bryobacteraceae bacterium]|nr:flagellar assembly protein FliW [Bryobacteraceae bacterium]
MKDQPPGMPHIATTHFGMVPYEPDSLIEFPAGLPAFETERAFLPIHRPQHEPLVFLQSLSNSSLAFLAIAVNNILVDYNIDLSDEETEALGGPGSTEEFDILALITISPSGQVTANLQAPIIIHRQRRLAVQSVQSNPAYSCRHPLGPPPEPRQEPPCS